MLGDNKLNSNKDSVGFVDSWQERQQIGKQHGEFFYNKESTEGMPDVVGKDKNCSAEGNGFPDNFMEKLVWWDFHFLNDVLRCLTSQIQYLNDKLGLKTGSHTSKFACNLKNWGWSIPHILEILSFKDTS